MWLYCVSNESSNGDQILQVMNLSFPFWFFLIMLNVRVSWLGYLIIRKSKPNVTLFIWSRVGACFKFSALYFGLKRTSSFHSWEYTMFSLYIFHFHLKVSLFLNSWDPSICSLFFPEQQILCHIYKSSSKCHTVYLRNTKWYTVGSHVVYFRCALSALLLVFSPPNHCIFGLFTLRFDSVWISI